MTGALKGSHQHSPHTDHGWAKWGNGSWSEFRWGLGSLHIAHDFLHNMNDRFFCTPLTWLQAFLLLPSRGYCMFYTNLVSTAGLHLAGPLPHCPHSAWILTQWQVDTHTVRSQDQCKFLQWFLSQTDANTTPGLFTLAWWAVKASGRFSQRFLSQVNSNMHQALHHGGDYAMTNVYQFGRVRIQWAKKISFSDKFFSQFIFNDWLTYGIHMGRSEYGEDTGKQQAGYGRNSQ